MTAAGLHLDWADHEAAVYAVMHWHYSQAMPTGRLIKVGVWEAGKFMGVVLFGRGANAQIGSPYDLKQTEICELVRVALRPGHATPVSRIGRDDGASPIRPLHPCGSQPQPSSGPGGHAPGPEEGGTP